MRYLLVGNYGVGNLGDEALKEYFLRAFPNVQWQVVSAYPEQGELPRLPGGLRSLLSLSWRGTARALRRSDGIVFGGGSLFTDIESPRACIVWWVHVAFARLFRKKIIFAFQGIGPFQTTVGEWCARCAVRWSFSVSVRDPSSAARVEAWKLNKKIVQSFDPVFCGIEKQPPNLAAQGTLIVIPREHSDSRLTHRVNELLAGSRFTRVRVLSLKPDSPEESAYCRSLLESAAAEAELVPVRTLSALSAEVSKGSLVLTQRYHGGIAALALGVDLEVMSQGEGDKLDSLGDFVRSTPSHGRPRRIGELIAAGEHALRECL